MKSQDSTIPEFRFDGYLPEGVCLASEAEIMFRFGSSSRRRRRLATLRLRRWVELARLVGGLRLLIDGSFITVKVEPDDIDAALELEEMILTRRPEELFAAEDETDWNEWTAFFSRTREAGGRRKGLVEVILQTSIL